MSRPQKRVKLLIPVNSNDCKSTKPKLAQKSDWDVSNKLICNKTFIYCYVRKKSNSLLGKSAPEETGLFLVLPIGAPVGQTVALFPLQIGVVPHELVETAAEGDEHQHVDEEELDDVDDHPTQRDLQRTQMRRNGEDVHRFQVTVYNYLFHM